MHCHPNRYASRIRQFEFGAASDSGPSLAAPIVEQVLAGPSYQVYRYHLLRGGLANLLSENLDICS